MANISKLKTAVKYSGFTKTFICKKVDIHPNMLYRYVNGIATPKVDTALRLCDLLGCNVYEIWGEGSDPVRRRF